MESGCHQYFLRWFSSISIRFWSHFIVKNWQESFFEFFSNKKVDKECERSIGQSSQVNNFVHDAHKRILKVPIIFSMFAFSFSIIFENIHNSRWRVTKNKQNHSGNWNLVNIHFIFGKFSANADLSAWKKKSPNEFVLKTPFK